MGERSSKVTPPTGDNLESHAGGPAPGVVHALIVTVGARACAIPVHHVSETMRPLPIEAVSGGSDFIQGLSVLRGAPVPVVDLNALLANGASSTAHGRFVTLKVDKRCVALAVDSVIGLRSLDLAKLDELPPLLRSANAELIEAIGTADAQLLVVLRAARIVSEEMWAMLEASTEAT